MTDLLEVARRRAYLIRFSGERTGDISTAIDRADLNCHRPLRRALDVTSEVTPLLFQVVKGVCANLLVPSPSVRARVYASEEMQAYCSLYGDSCLIEISSSLVEHLEPDEQAFVVGHELGHFLLDHHFMQLPPEGTGDRYRILRSREISADRLGFVAAGSAEAAMRAIMKTFSGLSDKHLRFDAASFLRRSFDYENLDQAAASFWDTHPSFAVRARCLLHFAPLIGMTMDSRWIEEFRKVEGRVEKDVDRFSESALQSKFSKLAESVKEWIWVSAAGMSGRISSTNMEILRRDLDENFVASVRSSFSGMAAQEVEKLIGKNLADAISEIEKADSKKAQHTIEHLCQQAEGKFDLDRQVFRFTIFGSRYGAREVGNQS